MNKYIMLQVARIMKCAKSWGDCKSDLELRQKALKIIAKAHAIFKTKNDLVVKSDLIIVEWIKPA